MNQKKAGVLLSYISEAIKILTSLIYTPIMLRLLGKSEYGLYQLVYSVVSYLGLLSLGFTSSYIRYYSRFKSEDNRDEISRLNGMFMVIFLVIAGITVICGFILLGNIRSVLGRGLTETEYETARVLMVLMVFNLAVTFPNSVFDCITSAHEKFFFQRLLTVLQNLLNPFLTLPLLLMGYGSIGMVVAATGLTVAKCTANIWYVFWKLHEKFVFHKFKFSMLKDIGHFTFFIFLNQVVDQINWSIDKFLLGRLLGTAAVAVYGLGGQINTMYMQLSSSVSSVFIPRVNALAAKGNRNHEISDLFIRIGRIQFLILSLVLTGFLFLGQPFMKIWGGSGYESSYYIVLWLIIPVTIPLIQNLGIEIQRAMNMHKARSIVYFLIAIFNILLSIPLIKFMGSIGAAMGTAISLLLGNGLFMNWYYRRKIGLDIKKFWKNIISFFPALAVPIMFGICIINFISIDNIGKLFLWGIIYTIIFCISAWFLGMNHSEKVLIKSIMDRIRRK